MDFRPRLSAGSAQQNGKADDRFRDCTGLAQHDGKYSICEFRKAINGSPFRPGKHVIHVRASQMVFGLSVDRNTMSDVASELLRCCSCPIVALSHFKQVS